MAERETLYLIRQNPGISQTAVAEARGVHRVSSHLTVRRLEKEGVVVVVRNGRDSALWLKEHWEL